MLGKSLDLQFRAGQLDAEQIEEHFQGVRSRIANTLGIGSAEGIIFTSSGVEAINMAVKGLAWGATESGRNEIVVVEGDPEGFHEAAVWCERFGFKRVILPLTSHGLIDPEPLETRITTKTVMVALSSVTPEILVPRELHVLGEHITSVGAKLVIAIDLELPIRLPHQAFHHADILTIDGEAIGAPSGTGLLILNSQTENPNSPVRLAPLISGGATQNGLRAGSISLSIAMGLSAAIEELSAVTALQVTVALGTSADPLWSAACGASADPLWSAAFTILRDAALQAIADHIPGAIIPWVTEPLPNGITFIVPDVEGEAVVMLCAQEGVFVSTGSACSRTAGKPSAVLTAIGFIPEEASGAIHLTFRNDHTVDDVRRGVEVIGKAVEKLRGMR